MRIIATKNYDEMSRAAASLIAAQVLQKPDSVLGLATGSRPSALIKSSSSGTRRGRWTFPPAPP